MKETTHQLNLMLAPYHWCWIPESRTLLYKSESISYAVPIDEMSTTANTLDWIFQLAEKTWLSRESLGAFVRAVNELIRPQACLCCGGNDQGPINVGREIPEGYRT